MRKWLVALMIVLSGALAAVVVGIRMSSDRKGPDIIFASNKNNSYVQEMKEEELLEGVTAVDEEEGDVSSTLTVEKVYEKNSEEVVVVYVAKDSSNNVTKANYVMQVVNSGTEEEKSFDEMEETNYMDEQIETGDEEEEETQELTKEEEAKKTQEEKIELLSEQAPRFYLTAYYLEISAGTSFDQLSFVSDIQDDVDTTSELYRKIQVTGSVDIYTPGTYELTYYVIDSDGNMSNEAVLTVVVQ